tara:strand:- start:909 stop:1652 length:744 start_codon:yes stop_codon:yes gene_type:complete
MNSISPTLNIMIRACEKASKVIVRDFGEIENLQVSKKSPKDYVTKTYKKVEEILIDELSKSKKKYSFITEESGIIENTNKDTCWIIDPIDGRTNFIHGVPHFAISISLKVKEIFKIGLVFDPIKNEIFYAEENSGAFLNNRRIRVSKKNNIENCLFGTGGSKLFKTDMKVRNSGCVSLDMAYVAAGRYDGYYHEKINIWDIAAGIVLIKEAGGIISKLDVNRIKNLKIVASSSEINMQLNANIDPKF